MTERPDIDACPDSATFRQWYYLKEELVAFARANKIKTAGGKFSIPFMEWMKANAGKTLADAVVAAKQIDADKRAGRKQPDQPHNQYNAYTRAYFAHVPDGSQNQLRQL